MEESDYRIINVNIGWGKTNYISYGNKIISYGVGKNNKNNNVLIFLQSIYSEIIYNEYIKIKQSKISSLSNNNYYGDLIISEKKINKCIDNNININEIIKNVEKYYPNIYVIKNLNNEYVYIECLHNLKLNVIKEIVKNVYFKNQ